MEKQSAQFADLLVWWPQWYDKGVGGEGNGQNPQPAGQGGLPSVVCRLATACLAFHRARSPHGSQSCVSFALSERALRLGRCRGAVLRSHGLGAQHWWLQWLERLKLQSMAHGWLKHRTGRMQRPAPGEWMVSPQHGSDKSTAESHVMPWKLTEPWEGSGGFTGEGWALVSWGQMGHGDDTRVVLAHGYMELQWSQLPLRKQNGNHTHHPGLLNTRISLQVWERFPVEPCSGAPACCSWKQDEEVMVLGRQRWELVIFILEMIRLQYMGAPLRGLWMSVHQTSAYKRNMDLGNSQLSQPLKCLWICVTNILRQLVLN